MLNKLIPVLCGIIKCRLISIVCVGGGGGGGGGGDIQCPYYVSITILQSCTKNVCCRLYCYECAARVTMPMATNERYFSGIGLYYSDND